ncbi:dihydrolipoyl dehydrogenase [Usitatibacter palustris]|uniref:Dihydrolipoyl dehydrogenase n=1 Tax=Usitatibacter palustris TaxID=2732487 RepID=A0A6M4H507_9PROT|nr:dihydrolipoyl dehydrogenase [Usitatibacter palustris]QJR14731.1 Dihydrolipoyl dehydrogenase [Usitatibacter palustris]
MQTLHVDVAVIGAGTAGLAAYRAARARGARAVLIEGGPYGTTCARVGCMPSKLLIAAAEAAHAIERAPGFGVHVDGPLRIDGREVMARVKRERDRFVGFVLNGVENIPEGDRLRGNATFIDRNTLQVEGGARVVARTVVIATGSRPSVPPVLSKLGDRLVINDDVFSWDDLPKSVAVFGPGVIGLEIGQALARLGVRVVILGRGGRVGPISDTVVRAAALKAFAPDFCVDPDAKVARVERVGDEVEIEYVDCGGKSVTQRFEYVLAATGRVPNIDRLAIENAKLPLNAVGAPAFDRKTLQVGDTPVFIAGDAANDMPLLHEAADEGRIAGDNAARFPNIVEGDRRAPLGIVFTDPQIAIVGGGCATIPKGSFIVGEVSFEDQGRSRVMLRNQGHLRVYADSADGRFLGAEMVGPDAEHIGHLLAWAVQMRMTVSQMLSMPFYHPVIEEGLRTALRDLDANLQKAQRLAA